MIDVYAADTAPPLVDVNRQLLNFIEVFELNRSGWVFSNFQNLQLTLWQLDPLRGSAFIPLPRWIQTRRAAVNVAGTDDDCFKWAMLACMHPVDVNADRRVKYVEHTRKYDFSSLSFPVTLQIVSSFALRNNMSINVYWVDDDNEMIYPIRVSSTLVPDRHVDLLLFECDGVQRYTTIRNFSRLVGRQLSNHGHTVQCCRRCLHAYSSQELLDAHSLDCCHVQRYLTQTGCQTEFLQRQPHYRLSDCYTVHCGNSYTESTHLCGLFRARLVKAAHVQLSLQSHVRKIPTSRLVAPAVDGHG